MSVSVRVTVRGTPPLSSLALPLFLPLSSPPDLAPEPSPSRDEPAAPDVELEGVDLAPAAAAASVAAAAAGATRGSANPRERRSPDAAARVPARLERREPRVRCPLERVLAALADGEVVAAVVRCPRFRPCPLPETARLAEPAGGLDARARAGRDAPDRVGAVFFARPRGSAFFAWPRPPPRPRPLPAWCPRAPLTAPFGAAAFFTCPGGAAGFPASAAGPAGAITAAAATVVTMATVLRPAARRTRSSMGVKREGLPRTLSNLDASRNPGQRNMAHLAPKMDQTLLASAPEPAADNVQSTTQSPSDDRK